MKISTARRTPSDSKQHPNDQKKKRRIYLIRRLKHTKNIFTLIFLSIFVATLPVLPIVYMRIVFGPVINSQSVSFLLWLPDLLISALALNGVLEWIRERVFLAGYIIY